MKRSLIAFLAVASFAVPYTASALTVDMLTVTDVTAELTGALPDGVNSIHLSIPYFIDPVPIGAAGSTEPISWLVISLNGEPLEETVVPFMYTVEFDGIGPIVVYDSFTLTPGPFGTHFTYFSGAASGVFDFGMGQQAFVESVFPDLEIKYSHAIDVIVDYNVTVVPVPAAVWLLGSGLLGLIGFRRKLAV